MPNSPSRAVLAGGCFWGMQDLIRRLPGVLSTRVGYTGGDTPNATYRNHGDHAEAIEIIFDPAKTSYRKLLEFFFQIHDPSTRNRQGNDVGRSYRSAILLYRRGAEADRARHDRRRRRFRPVAGQGGDRGRAGRAVLAGRARASGLSRALSQRLHLPLPQAGLGSAEAGGRRVEARRYEATRPGRGPATSRQSAKAATATWTQAFCRNSACGPKSRISTAATAGATIAAMQ